MAIRGDRVKQAREAAGITQEQLATACEVSQSAVVRWEQGVSEPRVHTLRTLARVLRVTPGWLLGHAEGTDEEPQVPPTRISGAIGAHPQWRSVREQLATIYSEDVLDEVATAQFATGPREYLDLEYARRLADAIAYARAQALR